VNLGPALDAVIFDASAPGLVDAFYDEAKSFAGIAFDGLGRQQSGEDDEGCRNRFTEADLLAVSLLDYTIRPPVVRRLLRDDVPRFSALLGRVPNCDLWEPSLSAADFTALDALYDGIVAIGGVKRTGATKLMSRKRPRITPIVDSTVAQALNLPGEWHFEWWADALKDPRRIDRLRILRKDRAVSLLRILDVAIWMTWSRSRSAKRVRADLSADSRA
jgi:hypothetical protein